MFDVFIIQHRRHSFQNSIKLFKLFKEQFESVYLLNAAGITDLEKKIISIGEYEFTNGFNEALRNVKKKYVLFVDGSLEIFNVDIVKKRLETAIEYFSEDFGSYSFHTENYQTNEESTNNQSTKPAQQIQPTSKKYYENYLMALIDFFKIK